MDFVDAHKSNMENMWKNACQQIFNLPIKKFYWNANAQICWQFQL